MSSRSRWQRPVFRIDRRAGVSVPGRWPATIPAVAQLLDRGLDLPAGVTFLVRAFLDEAETSLRHLSSSAGGHLGSRSERF